MTHMLRPFVIAALLVAATSVGWAGKDGSAGQIRSAVASGSVDAIIAEIERTEALMCPDCIDEMTKLLDHARYEVREAAGWWFAKRPTLKKLMLEQMVSDLGGSNATSVRNAADFIGAVRAYDQLGALSATYDRGLPADARFAIVRAAGLIGNRDSNVVLAKGMSDADAGVRRAATAAWREVRGQTEAAGVIALLSDSDAKVRAEAAATIGGLRDRTARVALEGALKDADPMVRRNAAWALGELGMKESMSALQAIANDSSPFVGGVVKAALQALR
jgi:HEAT repeat protein